MCVDILAFSHETVFTHNALVHADHSARCVVIVHSTRIRFMCENFQCKCESNWERSFTGVQSIRRCLRSHSFINNFVQTEKLSAILSEEMLFDLFLKRKDNVFKLVCKNWRRKEYSNGGLLIVKRKNRIPRKRNRILLIRNWMEKCWLEEDCDQNHSQLTRASI